MKVKIFFAWFDFWVGFYWDKKSRTLYFCPLPMIVIALRFGKKKSIEEFMRSADYLPGIMKDFHDCKDIFKRVNKIVQNGTSEDGSHKYYDLPNWVDAHVYTVDFFLWFMGQHGYTLQEDQRNVEFYDFEICMEHFRKEKLEEFKKFIEMERSNENN